MDVQVRENKYQTPGSHTSAAMGMHDCIEICLRCHQECLETLQYCIQAGGEHADPHHLKLLQTCMEICNTSARFMMLQSPYHQILCEVSAQICTACAKSCEDLHDDALTDCAKICMACADACQSMVGMKS
jgi:hypothetical protein